MYANLPDTHAIWTWVLWADENNSFQGTFLYFLFIESISTLMKCSFCCICMHELMYHMSITACNS